METDRWLFTNLMWPDYAESYPDTYGASWMQTPEATDTLRRLWHDPDVVKTRDEWIPLHQLREQLRADDAAFRRQWRDHIHRQHAIAERTLPKAVIRLVLNDGSV